MARPVPAVEVPKAYRVKEQQGSVHHRGKQSASQGEFEDLFLKK